ncbi:(2Fe-2S)-binding protein, partial [Streptomyces bohaiensis]|nr:(2Fe-2S)-binding protein [Streptomyces bohaiensis]
MNEERHGPQGGEPDPRHSDVPAPGTSWGGEYDSDATAFVQLPEGLIGDPGPGDPLAAPAHGYRPP